MGFEKYITVNHLNNAVIVSQNTLDYFKENEGYKRTADKIVEEYYKKYKNYSCSFI